MKKLMAIAVAAVVGGAFAACIEGPGPDPKTTPASVYQWRFTGKTGTGVITKTTWSAGGGCVESSNGADVEVIRVPGALAITAYTYICDEECQNFGTLLQGPTAAQFKFSKPFAGKLYNVNFIKSIDVFHVIGKAPTQYELGGDAEFTVNDTHDPAQVYTLKFAGFGSYNKAAGHLTSVAGNFAGTQTPPRYPTAVKVNGAYLNCPAADYWDCTTLDYAGSPNEPSVAYGTWSVKYNAAASKKLAANKNYRVLAR